MANSAPLHDNSSSGQRTPSFVVFPEVVKTSIQDVRELQERQVRVSAGRRQRMGAGSVRQAAGKMYRKPESAFSAGLRGGMGKKKLRAALDELAAVPEDEERVLLAPGRFYRRRI